MEQIKIKINDKEFIIRQSFKGLRYFESMTGINSLKMTEAENNLTNTVKMFYCLLSAVNADFEYNYEDFETTLDETPKILEDFNEYLQNLSRELPQEKKTLTKPKNKKL